MKVIPAREEPPGPHDPSGVVIESLRHASPSFEAAWAELAKDWHPEDVPSYIAAGAFAQHLADQLESKSTDEWPAIFDAIERLLRNDDPGVRYLTMWGLLEGMGNIASNTVGWEQARGFLPWFGPLTAEAWNEIHRYWGTGRHDRTSRDIRRR